MRRLILAASLLVAAAGGTLDAAAQSTPGRLPAPTPSGLGVIALPGVTDAAWPLAQALYADPSVRATAIDEAHARVLCGEPVASVAPADLRELAATVAALRSDEAPSRAILAGIAGRFGTRGLVVVGLEGAHPTARVFLAATGAFDAATYAPDDAPPFSWTAATRLLINTFGSAPAPAPAVTPGPAPLAAPALAIHEEPTIQNAPPRHKQFYESGWFWGALAAAAFGGGAIYLATRDNSSQTIHLEVQTPH